MKGREWREWTSAKWAAANKVLTSIDTACSINKASVGHFHCQDTLPRQQAQWSITRPTFDYGQPQSEHYQRGGGGRRARCAWFALIIYVELSEPVADWRQLSVLLFYMSNESDARLTRINHLAQPREQNENEIGGTFDWLPSQLTGPSCPWRC